MSDENVGEEVKEKINERLATVTPLRMPKQKPVRNATKDRSLRGKKRRGAKKLPPGEMNVEVNEENIDLFALDEYTGNSKEELLALASEAEESGTVLAVKLPNMTPKEDTNLFDVVAGEIVEGFDGDRCRYEIGEYQGNTPIYICIIHGKRSMFDVMIDPEAPCIAVDPNVKHEE
jgi:hypothetical protein